MTNERAGSTVDTLLKYANQLGPTASDHLKVMMHLMRDKEVKMRWKLAIPTATAIAAIAVIRGEGFIKDNPIDNWAVAAAIVTGGALAFEFLSPDEAVVRAWEEVKRGDDLIKRAKSGGRQKSETETGSGGPELRTKE